MDPSCPHKKGTLHSDSGAQLSAFLRQKDTATNADKFYVLLVVNIGGMYHLWIRYGRWGSPGQMNDSSFVAAASAVKEFGKKFKDKTGLTWANRNGPAISGKYKFLGPFSSGGGGDEDEDDDSDDHDDSSESGEDDEDAPPKKKPAPKAKAAKKVGKIGEKRLREDEADGDESLNSGHTSEVGSHGNLAGPLIGAISMKSQWKKKIKVRSIVENWKKEFTNIVAERLPPASIALVFNVAMQFLRALSKRSVAEAEGGICNDYEDAPPGQWSLKMTQDVDRYFIKCKCDTDCAMCGDGRFVDEDAWDDEGEELLPDDYKGAKTFKAFRKWQESKCKCFRTDEERSALLKKIRFDALRQDTIRDEDLIPPSLQAELAAAVQDAMSKLTEPDWHPGTNEQVLDLVHPSLFCFVKGVTDAAMDRTKVVADAIQVAAPAKAPKPKPKAKKGKKKTAASDDEDGSGDDESGGEEDLSESALFHWLPTDFTLARREDGEFDRPKPLGYINNLDDSRVQAAVLRVLQLMLPSFQSILSRVLVGEVAENFESKYMKESINNFISSGGRIEKAIRHAAQSANDFFSAVGKEMAQLRDDARAAQESHHEAAIAQWKEAQSGKLPWELDGRTIQVITKLSSIELTPEKPEYQGGVWHLEGIPQEKIIATGIYYYENTNVTDGRLDFRVGVNNLGYEVPQDGRDFIKYHYNLEVQEDDYDRHFGGDVHLGGIATKEGSCLFFPNYLQHKLAPMKLIDKTKPGSRKILVFFLIDPRVRITSTTDVPNQRLAGTMTLQEAKAFRELLMHDRKFLMGEESKFFERHFSLCEH